MLFGKTSLNMSSSALVIVGILTPLSGILGSLVWPILQRRFKWSNLKIVITLVILCSVIPAYGCLGFVFQGRTRFGGLTSQGEMFGLAVYFGFVYGAFQAYARALYAEMLPPGEEARWYGLFSITDKVQVSPPITTNLRLFSVCSVQLLRRSTHCGLDIGRFWQHPLFLLFPCVHDMAGRAYFDERGCGQREEGCEEVSI